jgi:farnesyl diphosphate synthase
MIATSSFSDDVKIELIRCFGENVGGSGMVLGQAIDCYFENKKLHIDELKFLHIHKTAKLIAASLKMGGIIVDLPKEKLSQLYDIGLKIGLLFQVQDDIIDATKSSEQAGKPTSNDISKNSFTNLLGVERALEHRDELKRELLKEIESLDTKLSIRLKTMIDRYFR